MSEDYKVQWSVSLPPVAQYAKGHMFNFRGETVDELNAIFEAVLETDTLEKAAAVASILCAIDVVQNVGNYPDKRLDRPDFVPQEDAGAGASNVVQLKTCAHGKRQFKNGANKNTGKAWAGWFCPERNKSAQCDVVWDD